MCYTRFFYDIFSRCGGMEELSGPEMEGEIGESVIINEVREKEV